MFNKITLIGRLGQNAEAKTDQNTREFVVLNIATQESWKNDKGDYEARIESHRVYAWNNLSKFAKTLQRANSSPSKGPFATAKSKTTSRALQSSTGSPKSTPPASSASRRSRHPTIPQTRPAMNSRSALSRTGRQPRSFHLPRSFCWRLT